MSVTTAATVVEADHHKLMLCASPLGRQQEILEPGHGHGLIGAMLGKKSITRGDVTLTPETLAQFMEFAVGGATTMTITLPFLPAFCQRFNLKNGSYIELMIKNGHGAGSGVITVAAATDSGFAVYGTATIAAGLTRKIGIYVKDSASLVNADGADVFVL